MPVGLGGGGFVGIAIETVMGTYVAPTIYAPILNETLQYNEAHYYSPQIRKQTMVSDGVHGFYHAEGDIQVEADLRTLPYFLHACRLSVVKTGAGPWVYTYTPSSGASSGIGAGAATTKTLSLTIVRNAKVFKYVGCVFGGYVFTIEDGVLKVTFNAMALGETGLDSDSPPSPTFNAPALLAAGGHVIATDVAGLTPAFATPDVNFNGFTFTVSDNAAAQNRIVANRQATYISFGETEATMASQLDFVDRVEYEKFTGLTKKAFRLTSTNGAESCRITAFNAVYDTYPVALGGMGDLIMADMTARLLNITGGSGFEIVATSSTANIT